MVIVTKELVSNMAGTVVEKEAGVAEFFAQKKLDQIKLLYRVFRLDPKTFPLILGKMGSHILDQGREIVNNEENQKDPLMYTNKLMEMRAQADEMLSYCFDDEIVFRNAVEKDFIKFLNEPQENYTASYLAQFIDHAMKEGLKGVSEEEVDKRCRLLVNLFKSLDSHDVFMRACEQSLASRLLNKTTQSSQNEEIFLQKLKVECGVQEVSKMTKMMQDID